jgi:hypothetical protein
MDRDRTAAHRRRPSMKDERIAWPFGPGFPSSDPQRTPPKGASCCAHRDASEGLTSLDTVDREAMPRATQQTAPRSAPKSAARRLTERMDETLQVLVDQGAGRVLVRDRGETVGYELRMRERFGRAWGLGWVELLLGDDGSVVETGVSAAEVMAVAADADREREVADLSRWAARELIESGDPVADRMGRRLLEEMRAGFELKRVSLRALQARMLERIEAGETLVTMCERAGFVDRDGRIDTTWLQRRAGLLPDRCSRSGKVRRARTASYEVFLRLMRAVDGTPEESGSDDRPYTARKPGPARRQLLRPPEAAPPDRAAWPARARPRPPPSGAEDELALLDPPSYFSALAGVELPVDGGMIPCPLPDHEDSHASCQVFQEAERGWWCFGCCRGGRVYDLASLLAGGPWGRELRHDAFARARELAAAALR